jgi:hypothetical protein
MGGQILDLTEEERDIGVQMISNLKPSECTVREGSQDGQQCPGPSQLCISLPGTEIETLLLSCTSCMFSHTWNLLDQPGAPGPKPTQMS